MHKLLFDSGIRDISVLDRNFREPGDCNPIHLETVNASCKQVNEIFVCKLCAMSINTPRSEDSNINKSYRTHRGRHLLHPR
jgi:hypothetical protein